MPGMKIIRAKNLACPLDSLALTPADKQYVCPQGHSFDVARQSYLNLLPVQHKRSRHPGDSPEMVQARTAFLNSHAYLPIAEQLNAITLGLLLALPEQGLCLLDAGCGEGYYLEQLAHCLQQTPRQLEVALVGLDISKPAILAASKRSKLITWLIASNRQPPLLPASVDIILCLFGFPVYPSFKRLLKATGKIILVESAPGHLLELRNIIYPNVSQSPPPSLHAAEAAGFQLLDEVPLCYRRSVESNPQIMNLLTMTPHYFRASFTGKQAVNQLNTIEITVDVVFRVLGQTARSG
jgi:23S rRNA (guanine745-N1)-methyltransferase